MQLFINLKHCHINYYINENTVSVQVDGSKTITTKKLDIEKSIAEENQKRIQQEMTEEQSDGEEN